MRFFVGVTDYDWFSYLSAQQADEVNFWQPSGNTQFRALQPGEPFLFKLHSPRNVIAGGGYFSHFSLSPLSFRMGRIPTEKWRAFARRNEGKSMEVQEGSAPKHAGGSHRLHPAPAAFFLSEPDWVPVPDWPRSIVRGKGYDTVNEEGRRIWEQVQARLTRPFPVPDESVLVATQKYGKPQIVLPRLGQGAFRMIVADSYLRQCALSSSHILHILEAAHIRPYTTAGGTHSPTNGILLRQDIHTLFDRGYITVTPDYRVEVSKRIREEFNNGMEYYAMHGKQIHLPNLEQLRPSKESLDWHNETVYLK